MAGTSSSQIAVSLSVSNPDYPDHPRKPLLQELVPWNNKIKIAKWFVCL